MAHITAVLSMNSPGGAVWLALQLCYVSMNSPPPGQYGSHYSCAKYEQPPLTTTRSSIACITARNMLKCFHAATTWKQVPSVPLDIPSNFKDLLWL